jgi:hypothetical protein
LIIGIDEEKDEEGKKHRNTKTPDIKISISNFDKRFQELKKLLANN